VADGAVDRAADGVADGADDGAADGAADGVADGADDGAADGVADCADDGAADGVADCAADVADDVADDVAADDGAGFCSTLGTDATDNATAAVVFGLNIERVVTLGSVVVRGVDGIVRIGRVGNVADFDASAAIIAPLKILE
jgi:hypothetical protein